VTDKTDIHRNIMGDGWWFWGLAVLVFTTNTFSWLEHHAEFALHLGDTVAIAAKTNEYMIYDLNLANE